MASSLTFLTPTRWQGCSTKLYCTRWKVIHGHTSSVAYMRRTKSKYPRKYISLNILFSADLKLRWKLINITQDVNFQLLRSPYSRVKSVQTGNRTRIHLITQQCSAIWDILTTIFLDRQVSRKGGFSIVCDFVSLVLFLLFCNFAYNILLCLEWLVIFFNCSGSYFFFI